MKANAVFEGGGIRGIGHIGAISYLESIGYEWNNVAGTSAGAIIAGFIAAGYNSKEIKKMLSEVNFLKFMDKSTVQRLPVFGKTLGFVKEKGIYSGEYAENWIEDILKAKGVITFGDLAINGKSNLKIIAADITKKRTLILPEDLRMYGVEPLTFPIARAIRMSISIPLYFKPIEFHHKDGISLIVDGGIVCNFPIEVFDTNKVPDIPTFGFRFDAVDETNSANGKTDILSFICDIGATMACETNTSYTVPKNIDRTIVIPAHGISSTDFDISKEEALKIFKSGYKSAEQFISAWDFDCYKKKYYNEDITA